MFYCVRVH